MRGQDRAMQTVAMAQYFDGVIAMEMAKATATATTVTMTLAAVMTRIMTDLRTT
jgi:hypothetical protein